MVEVRGFRGHDCRARGSSVADGTAFAAVLSRSAAGLGIGSHPRHGGGPAGGRLSRAVITAVIALTKKPGELLAHAGRHVRKFSPARATADVVRFVAEVRIRLGPMRNVLDPRTVENLIHRTLGDIAPDTASMATRARVQLLLLVALVRVEVLDPEEIDAVLGAARAMAERIIAADSTGF